MLNCVISGTGLYTPQECISNNELVSTYNQHVEQFNTLYANDIALGNIEAKLPSSTSFIEKASGIYSRYVMEKKGILDPTCMHPQNLDRDERNPAIQSDMAVAAAKQAIEEANISSTDIDAVIVACSNMPRPYPALAIEVQQQLGASGYAYDLNVACASAPFGIQNAVTSIVAGQTETVLVVNPEICTAHLNFKDRDSHFIFGDACAATIIQSEAKANNPNSFKILDILLRTQFSNNIRNNFGFLNKTQLTPWPDEYVLFHQEGRKVFKEVIPLVVEAMSTQLERNHISPSKIKRLWLHQANINMNQLIAKKILNRDPLPEEAPNILSEYANTSSAGSVISFHKYKEGLVCGELGQLVAFGAGYSIGTLLLQKL